MTEATFEARETSKLRHPDTFVKLAIGELESLDPALPYDTRSWEIMANVYETLFVYSRVRGAFAPLLAREVPTRENGLVSEDGLVYRIPIRSGVRFHGGEPLTPDDVAYSLRRLLVHDHAYGPAWMLLEPLAGVTHLRAADGTLQTSFDVLERAIAVEGEHVVIRLRQPFAPLLAVLTTPPTSVLCRTWAVAHGDWSGSADDWDRFGGRPLDESHLHRHMNGTGPYELVEWRPDREVELVRNDGYWRDPAAIERAFFVRENDWDRRREQLFSGEADMVQVDRTSVPEIEGHPGIRIYDDLRLPVCDTVSFNLRVEVRDNAMVGSGRLDGNGIPPDFFSDVHVRRGFQYCFDWDRVVDEVHLGKAVQMKGPLPSGLFGHNPDQRTYHHDLRRAEEELRQAWGGELWARGFRCEGLWTEGNRLREGWMTVLAENLAAVNPLFRLEPKPIDLADSRRELNAGRLPVYTVGWLVDYPDPHNFVQPMLHGDGVCTRYQAYRNDEVDRLVSEGVLELDPDQRREIYHRLQDLAYRDAKDIYTVEPLGLAVFRSWVRGWEYDLITGPQAVTLLYGLSKVAES
jgi:peptide/nickel transport system substrate-binding protein